MYISEEQKTLEQFDSEFRALVKNADNLAKSTAEEITDLQMLEYEEMLEKVKKPTHKTNGIKIENGVLLRNRVGCETVFIPEGVVEIGKEAFANNGNLLTKIVLPNGLKKIDDRAFADKYDVFEISVKDPELCYPAEALGLVGAGDEIDQFSKGFSQFPNTLEEIGNNAFRSFGRNAKNRIEYLLLPKTLRKIGASAFSESGIKRLYFNGPDTIVVSCFQTCRYLKKVIIDDSIKRIDRMAFESCAKLEEVLFSRRLKEICDLAFAGCASLEQVELPEQLEKIGKYVFCDCSKLSRIKIPSSVKEIGDNAFQNCKNLVIYASEGSYAEQYAKENNIKFEAI